MKNQPLATLAIQRRDTSRPLIFDKDSFLVGRLIDSVEKKYKIHDGKSFLAGFCGVHIISSQIFNHFKESGTFDIFTTYFRLISEKINIIGYDIGNLPWNDVGTINSYRNFSSK
jgi:NDP-sugar pyrophosphorylase family protein